MPSTRTTLMIAALTVAALAATPAGAEAATAAKVPTLTATIGAEHLSAANAWTPVLAAQPGERLRVLVGYMNTSPAVEHGARVSIKLPRGATMNGTVTLTDGTHPAGTAVSAASLTGHGVTIGNYAPGTNGYLTFFIRMPPLKYDRCGITLLTLPVEERVAAGHSGAVLHLHAHNDCPVNTGTVASPA